MKYLILILLLVGCQSTAQLQQESLAYHTSVVEDCMRVKNFSGTRQVIPKVYRTRHICTKMADNVTNEKYNTNYGETQEHTAKSVIKMSSRK
jgi:hypothetical protein